MDRLQQFIDWVKAGNGRRNVKIDIGEPYDKDYLRIWVYDYDLKTGMYVNSVEEIGLEAEKEKEEKKQYEVLKAKFEGSSVANF